MMFDRISPDGRTWGERINERLAEIEKARRLDRELEELIVAEQNRNRYYAAIIDGKINRTAGMTDKGLEELREVCRVHRSKRGVTAYVAEVTEVLEGEVSVAHENAAGAPISELTPADPDPRPSGDPAATGRTGEGPEVVDDLAKTGAMPSTELD